MSIFILLMAVSFLGGVIFVLYYMVKMFKNKKK